MTHKNSLPDTTQPETDDGTIEITIDDACMAAAVAAQTELIDMLARLVLESIEWEQQKIGKTSDPPVRSTRTSSQNAR